ncbi:hypothetical protein BKA82DRAFT_126686, partial [Pisolithus tinctorius]
EEEALRLKEHKKYKAKFMPIHNIKAPTGPVNIPAPYAFHKLLKGEYCELYFFTNAGLAEAESFNPSVDNEALTLLKTDNGQHLWVPASASRDKASVIKDEDLTVMPTTRIVPRIKCDEAQARDCTRVARNLTSLAAEH